MRVQKQGSRTRHFAGNVGAIAQLAASPPVIPGAGGIVNVTFTDVSFAGKGDWIGVWPATANLTLFSAPIKFKYAFPYDQPPDPFTPQTGWVTFNMQVMREPVFFAYVSGNIEYPQLIAVTTPVKFEKPNTPFGAHLALAPQGSPDAMRVYWTVGPSYDYARIGVKWGMQPANSSGWYANYAPAFADAGRQYTQLDMCDRTVEPASRQGWIKPGVLVEASLEGLVPNTRYYYSYGDDWNGWSTERSFMSPPAVGPNSSTTIAAFGDMGQAETDGSCHHSWDFNDKGEYPAINTTDSLNSDPSLDLVLHIGDISYAVGYLSEWDNFLHQIEPVASRMPWMTTIGNHEQGWSGSYFPMADSGGECGVPYNAHFPFASQDYKSTTPFSERQPWYSFSHGPVAYVHMSTEHDFTQGSAQLAWIEKALASVDRTVTPWLVFTGHRPMYVASAYSGDQAVAQALRDAIEGLLSQYKVDLAIWGHNHSFQRFCGGLFNNTCGNTNGVQHAVIGMAGYAHTKCPSSVTSPCQLCNDENWGYTRLSFDGQSTTAQLDFISNGVVIDTFSFARHA